MKTKISSRVIFFLITVLAFICYSGQSYGQPKSVKDVCSDFSNALTGSSFSILQTDPGTCRCYVDVTYHWPVTSPPAKFYYPYGIDVSAFDAIDPTHPDVINVVTNVEKLSGFGTWSSCIPTGPNPAALSPANPTHYYGWRTTTACSPTANTACAIPWASTLKFRVYLNFQNTTKITLTMRELTWACVDNSLVPDNWSMCSITQDFSKPIDTIRLVADCYQVCAGTPYTTIHLIPTQTQSNCVQWDWYACKMMTGGTCPSINPFSSQWVFKQHGGNELYTGNLDDSYCYVVKLTNYCCTYVTPPIQVILCPDPSSIGGITVAPLAPVSNLQWIADSNAYYACGSWKTGTVHKTFTVPDLGYCYYTVEWSIDSTGCGTSFQPVVPPTNPKNIWDLTLSNTRFSCPLTQCYKCYIIRAVIKYNCCSGNGIITQQSLTKTAKIIINSPTKVGYITSQRWDMCGPGCPWPPPPSQAPSPKYPILCYNRATILDYIGDCYHVDRWDSLSKTGWVPITGAGNEYEWWTNKLKKISCYRITVHNGVCPSVTSPVIKVRVKPLLIATIAGCSMLCPGHTCLLTASTSYSPPGYYVKYTWYKNGAPIAPPQHLKTLTVSAPGNYAVQVLDLTCQTDTMSNTITICKPAIVFTGRPCFCHGTSFTISAGPNDCYQSNCTTSFKYSWTGPGSFTSTQAQISNNVPGVYTVTMDCNPSQCILTASITITECP